jgi:1,4-dihydroxy-2-naphthoyl-CoA hydrolase
MKNPIWTQSFTLDTLHQRDKGTFSDLLGISFEEVGNCFLKGKMKVTAKVSQPFGILHGGATAALAETLASIASSYCIEPHQQAVGIELNINHIKSAKSGVISGLAEPIHLGKSTHVWSIKIFNELNDLIAISRLTLAILDKKIPN